MHIQSSLLRNRELRLLGCGSLTALFRALQVLADDRADGLNQDDDDEHQTLEGVLNVNAEAGAYDAITY